LLVVVGLALLLTACGEGTAPAVVARDDRTTTTRSESRLCYEGDDEVPCSKVPWLDDVPVETEVGVTSQDGRPSLVVRACEARPARITLIWTPDRQVFSERADEVSSGHLADAITPAERVVEMAPAAFVGDRVFVAPLSIDLNPTFDFTADDDHAPGWIYAVSGSDDFAWGMLPEGPWPDYPGVSTADGSDLVTTAGRLEKECQSGHG
jgi:hypothetical protein